MPEVFYVKNLLLKVARNIRQALIALGTPPLFFFKIIVWTLYWLVKEAGTTIVNLYYIAIGTFSTFSWFYKLILKYPYRESLRKLVPKNKLPKKSTRPIHSTLYKTHPTLPRPRLFRDFILIFLGFFLCFFFIFIPYGAITFLTELPNPKVLANPNYPVTTKIYDRNGLLLYQIYSNQNRTPLTLDEIPKDIVNATIAIEDKNFYNHPGFDSVGIARALINNLSGQPTQGGSTITQQLIKSALLSPERTYTRKTKELILSVWTEQLYPKEKILEMYLNQVPYGGASYGIEAAAQTYFNKHTKDLTLAESALLAGLPSAPSVYSPFGSHPELAKQRQVEVLEAMVDQKYITAQQSENAKLESLKYAPLATEIKAPHFVMYIKDLLIQKYGIREVEQGGLEVVTTLDYSLYEMASKEIKNGVEIQKYLNVNNAATLITNPKTGEILAMVGSRDYFDKDYDGNVNVTLAKRSPGSSIKVISYAAAMEKNLISPGTVLDDSPTTFQVLGSPGFSPRNYDGKFHGKVTVRTALGSSYNIPAVKILERLGVKTMIAKGGEMGIESWKNPDNYGLALTLGGGETSMIELASVYQVLANSGLRAKINPILKITNYKGQTLEDNFYTREYPLVISPQVAFLISDILSDNAARSPAFGPNSALVIPNHTVSVKTGTAETKRDNWAIGYTPSFLAAVWVGNNDNSPMSPYLESGNTGAAAIWHNIMVNLLKDKPDEPFVKPDGIVTGEICGPEGNVIRQELFISGTQPSQNCKPLEKKPD